MSDATAPLIPTPLDEVKHRVALINLDIAAVEKRLKELQTERATVITSGYHVEIGSVIRTRHDTVMIVRKLAGYAPTTHPSVYAAKRNKTGAWSARSTYVSGGSYTVISPGVVT